MMSHFSYLAEKIKKTDFSYNPFKLIYIENFFSEEDFNAILKCPEILGKKAQNDIELIYNLKKTGYKIINFPGCITDINDYIKWHKNKQKIKKIHSACEGFGMVMRLYEKKSQILIDLEEFLLSEEFNSAICFKLGIKLSECKVDGGIQKYLDGYEISPHPDVRKKAATYMVNINPSTLSETFNYHTHYLKFKNEKKYISSFWENNTYYDRDWLPWDWCETVMQQSKNNSIVIFAPSNDTMHAVKADYDHLATQRTQLYGNLWFNNSVTSPLKWEQLQIPSSSMLSTFSFKSYFKRVVPKTLKSVLKSTLRHNTDIGKTNMN